jgi:membrane peptidoglycan carboxypeptidase
MAEKMGLFQFSPPELPQQIIKDNRGSFTLGAEATSPLGLASAYSTLAASGTQCDVVPVTAILDRFGHPLLGDDGTPLLKGDQCTPEAIPPGVARTLNQMLRKDVEPGYSGQTARRAYVPGHQIAGKTGTSQKNYSVAFVGYTPEYTASVMVLNPKENQDVGGFGGGKGATIWHDAMAPILEARGSSDFPPADPAVEAGNTRPVPRCSSVPDCQSVLREAGFRVTTLRIDSDKAEGSLVGTTPPGGGRAVQGQVITILISNGSAYVPPVTTPPSVAAPPPSSSPAPSPTPSPEPDPGAGPPPDPGGGGGAPPGTG